MVEPRVQKVTLQNRESASSSGILIQVDSEPSSPTDADNIPASQTQKQSLSQSVTAKSWQVSSTNPVQVHIGADLEAVVEAMKQGLMVNDGGVLLPPSSFALFETTTTEQVSVSGSELILDVFAFMFCGLSVCYSSFGPRALLFPYMSLPNASSRKSADE